MSSGANKYLIDGWHKDGYNIAVTVECSMQDLNKEIKQKGITEIYRVKLVSRGDGLGVMMCQKNG